MYQIVGLLLGDEKMNYYPEESKNLFTEPLMNFVKSCVNLIMV